MLFPVFLFRIYAFETYSLGTKAPQIDFATHLITVWNENFIELLILLRSFFRFVRVATWLATEQFDHQIEKFGAKKR